MNTLLSSTRLKALAAMLCLAGSASAQQPLLDRYIDSAFANNIVLQQKNISLERAGAALDIAKGWFLPTVSFQLGYQTAKGGRDINLPLGDLLNGVYSTLNQLTGSNNFPQLKNESVNFLPNNFYDAKVRTTMPVYNPDLRFNKKIAEQQIVLNEYEVDIYKRQLVQSIKTAYFNYLTALRSVAIYRNALELANEGKRVNQKLLDNGKGLPAYVLRSNSEIEQVNAQINTAEQQAENAKLYFNFLLNREQTTDIDTAYSPDEAISAIGGMLATQPLSANREELKALQQAVNINETVWQMNKQVYMPRLNAFLDLGSQAEDWKINSQSRYYLLGLQLEVPIFAGNRNKNKIKQSQLDVQAARLNLEQVRQQLTLGSSAAKNNLKASWQTYTATEKQLEAASSYQRLIERGYREGTNTFIETVDARNQFTQAQLLQVINQYKVLIAAADLERETASYLIKK
ncbi:MAG: TolC family protein [Chitinophagaceae bacterium]